MGLGLPHVPWLQLVDWLDDPEHEPIPLQDLYLIFVPLPQLLLHDPYDPQELQEAVNKGKALPSLSLFSVFVPNR